MVRWQCRGQKSPSVVSVGVCKCVHIYLVNALCNAGVQPGYNRSRCPVYTVYALYREDQLLKRKTSFAKASLFVICLYLAQF